MYLPNMRAHGRRAAGAYHKLGSGRGPPRDRRRHPPPASVLMRRRCLYSARGGGRQGGNPAASPSAVSSSTGSSFETSLFLLLGARPRSFLREPTSAGTTSFRCPKGVPNQRQGTPALEGAFEIEKAYRSHNAAKRIPSRAPGPDGQRGDVRFSPVPFFQGLEKGQVEIRAVDDPQGDRFRTSAQISLLTLPGAGRLPVPPSRPSGKGAATPGRLLRQAPGPSIPHRPPWNPAARRGHR